MNENLAEDIQDQEDGYYNRAKRYGWSKVSRAVDTTFEETFGTEIDTQALAKEIQQVEDLEDIASVEATEPSFPFFTFYIALALDILDFADFTGVGWFIMCVVEIIFTIFLFILMFRKTNTLFKMGSKRFFGRGGKKRFGRKRGGTSKSPAQRLINNFVVKYLKKYMTRRLLATLLINIIPFIGILASNAFFVYIAHNKQKKIVQKYMLLIEGVNGILKDYYKRTGR